MARGCRDCGTCTKPSLVRWGQWWAMAFVYVCTAGIAWLVKRGMMRGCPQCKHLMGSHQRRADGSFKD